MIGNSNKRTWLRTFSFGLAFLLPILWSATLPGEPKEMEPIQLRTYMRKNPGTQLIDVRTSEERQRGKISRSKHIPVGEISSARDRLNMEKPVITYCRSGRRGQTAAEILDKMGFREVYNLRGGIKAYSIEVDTSIRAD